MQAQTDTSCTVASLPSTFNARVAWQATGRGPSSLATPVVGNMNPHEDDIPEIIALGGKNVPNQPTHIGFSNEIFFFRGDGSNKANPMKLTVQGVNFHNYPAPGPTIADVNNDGKPELLIICLDRKIRVYHNYRENPVAPMDLWITTTDLVDMKAQRPMLADFDSDGTPEVYVGSDIFRFNFTNPANPTLNKVLDGPIFWGANLTGQLFYQQHYYQASNPVAADLLTPTDCNGDPDCNGLEIAAGMAIYSVDLDPNDGDGLEIKMQRYLPSTGQIIYFDGYTSVADIDLDGVLDVLVSSKVTSETGMYAWNKNGFLRFFPFQQSVYNSNGAVPCVANVFDDRTQGFAVDLPEILLTDIHAFHAFNIQASQKDPAAPYWWRLPASGSTGSGYSPAVTFDFNGDGIQEILYGADKFRILYGGAAPFPPGVDSTRTWHRFSMNSSTTDKHPVIADVDNDNEAEIVLTYWPGYFDQGQVEGTSEGVVAVVESGEGPWMPTRKVWNQYNYFVVNVNDDLTIPAVQQPHHLEMPPGSGNRPLNQTLFQESTGRIPLPDASAALQSVFCQNNQVQVQVEVCNFGLKDLGDSIPIAFYAGDPTTTNAALLGAAQVLGVPVKKDSCVLVDFLLPPFSGTVYGMVNDDGSLPRPFNLSTAFPVNYVFECHWQNNLFPIDYTIQQPPFDLGPDVSACGDTVLLLDAGPGRLSYLWQDGSTGQTFQAQGPGQYWVRVQDACVGYRMDTLRVQATGYPVGTGMAVTGACLGLSNGSVSFLGAAQGTPPYALAWSTGVNDPNLNNLAPGAYTLQITDAIGCTASETVQVPLLEAPTLTAMVQDIPCFGAANGSISVGISGGTPGIGFAWSNSETTPDVQDLAPGTYALTVTYADGHCAETFDFQIQQPAELLLSGTTAVASCPGAATGTATLLGVSQGTAPYTYLWSNGDTGLSSTNLAPGAYTVVATDAKGCTRSETVQVGAFEVPVLVPVIQNVSCAGDTDGAVFTSLSGGTPGFGYAWSNGAATPYAQALGAGTYGLTVTYADGLCVQQYNFSVAEPQALLSGGFATTAACPGQSNGSAAFLGVAQGTPPYTLVWSSGDSLPDLNDVSAGTYTLLVTDANGCTLSETVQVPEHVAPVLTPTIQPITCFGANDGGISAAVSGGTPGFGFAWSNGETTPDIQNLAPGMYTLDLTFAGGVCAQTFDFQLAEPLPLLSAGVNTVAACENEANGSVEFLGAAQGVPPYGLLWSNGGSTPDLNNLPAGTYSLVVTDANGCTLTETAQVGELAAPTLNAAITPAFCAGATDGAISLSVSGGTLPLGYQWSNGASTPDLPSLGSGTYSLTVTYAGGLCAQYFDFSVAEPQAILSAGFTTVPACIGQSNGSAIFLGASQGTPPYTLSWSPGSSGQNLTNVPAGTYVLTITDANGCTMSQSVQVPEYPIPFLVPSVDPVSCFGADDGGISITVAGGQPGIGFLWSNGQTLPQLQQLQPGVYDLTVTYANGACAQALSFEIPEPIELLASGITAVAACTGENNGSLSFLGMSQGVGPFSLEWSNGGTTPDQTGLTNGTYTLTVTNSSGCSLTVSAEVPTAEAPQVATVAADVTCFGAADGSATATALGGGTASAYAWSNGASGPIQNNLGPGAYTLTVTYGGGLCTLEFSFDIDQPSVLQTGNAELTHVLCHGETTGAVAVSPAGGTAPYQTAWSGGQTGNVLQPVPAGTYGLTLTDANGCTVAQQYIISQPAALALTTVSLADTCAQGNGSVAAAVAGGVLPYNYSWWNGANTPAVTGLAAGTYSLTITDANQCTQTLEAVVTQWTSVPILSTFTDTITCAEPVATIGVIADQSNLHYVWSGPSGILPDQPNQSVAVPGNYSVVAENAFGCTTSATVPVAENTVAPLAEAGPGQVSAPCDAGEVTLDAGGSSSVGPEFLPMWQHIVGGTPVSETPALILVATEPGLYVFSNLNTQNGCSASDSVVVDWTPPVEAAIAVEQISCFGENDGSIQIEHLAGGLAPITFSIDGQSFGTNPDFTGLAPGTYTVVVSDAQGCIWQSTAVLTQPKPFSVALTASDTLLDLGQYLFLSAQVTPPATPVTDVRWLPDGLAWTPGLLKQKLKPEETTQYEVQVTDVFGCTATAALLVQVVNYGVYAPNAIMPGSVENGAFTLYAGPGIERIKLLRVFDRWGSLVFEKRGFAPNDPSAGWNGSLGAQPFSPGVFVWYAELEGVDGRVLIFNGDVTVTR
jgi:hypothetical protein